MQNVALGEAQRAQGYKESLETASSLHATTQAKLDLYEAGAGLCLRALGDVGSVEDIVGHEDLRWVGIAMRQRLGFATLEGLLVNWRRTILGGTVQSWKRRMADDRVDRMSLKLSQGEAAIEVYYKPVPTSPTQTEFCLRI